MLSTASTGIVIKCPKCGKQMEKTAWSFKCDCGIMFSRRICSREMKDEEIKELIEKKTTKKLTGFKSKANKPFAAKIILDEDNKTQFKFD